jgi:hypothetical protein
MFSTIFGIVWFKKQIRQPIGPLHNGSVGNGETQLEMQLTAIELEALTSSFTSYATRILSMEAQCIPILYTLISATMKPFFKTSYSPIYSEKTSSQLSLQYTVQQLLFHAYILPSQVACKTSKVGTVFSFLRHNLR